MTARLPRKATLVRTGSRIPATAKTRTRAPTGTQMLTQTRTKGPGLLAEVVSGPVKTAERGDGLLVRAPTDVAFEWYSLPPVA
jgi:hypothetical protein